MSELDAKADEQTGENAEQNLPTEADADVVTPPPSVGEQLAAAREARGLKVADVAQTLKLGARQVAALEGNNWQALPGPTFIRGFVRNYARLVGLDAAPLMAMLEHLLEKPAAPLTPLPARQPPMRSGGGARRDRLVMVTGGVLLLLAALAYFLIPGDLSNWHESAQNLLKTLSRQPEEPPAPPEPAFPPGATPQQIINPHTVEEAAPASAPTTAPETAAPAPITATAAPAASAAAASAGASAVSPAVASAVSSPPVASGALRLVADKESWIEVRDRDNRLIFSQRLAAGSEQVLNGSPPLSLVIGYAPGVRLTWRGKAVDLAASARGDVARLALE